MRKIILLVLVAISVSVSAQSLGDAMYVAAKSGLSIRENPDAAAKVLDKIPYGTKVNLIDEDGGWKEIVTEGLSGFWRKVKFNNKTGYIVDSYLFPWPPPKLATVKELKQYLAQVAAPFGQKLTVRSGPTAEITESGWVLKKQLYKNGAEHHELNGYENGSDTYFLPNFSLGQGFLLCRLIAEFKEVFGEKDEFPTATKKIKKGDREVDIEVSRYGVYDEDAGSHSIQKIKIMYEDVAYYEFEMYYIQNQLVITFSSGL